MPPSSAFRPPRRKAEVSARVAWPAPLGVLLALVPASAASAHGIGGEAETAGVAGFIGIGITHMLLGWDHLLFVAGIVLLAGSVSRAAKVISAFVLGHSLTLITATLAGWQVNATLVDVVIVLSVAFVGGWGMFGRPRRWGPFTAVVLGFGLIHGVGLATRFQALDVPQDGMLWRLIAFNVGIEIGQLTAIVALLAGAGALSMLLRQRHDATLVTTAFVALFGIGSMVAPLLAYEEFAKVDGDAVTAAALPADAECSVGERTLTLPAGSGGHASKAFYGPGEDAPLDNFGHSLGDGYVVVLYRDDLPQTDVAALRDFVASEDPAYVLAGVGEVPEGEVLAITQRQEMSCETVHVDALRSFSTTWLDSIGADT